MSITPVVPVSITPVHDLDEALPERQASPPTAFFKLVPEHHNGVDAFTFRTYFSEEIAMSYKTLRVCLHGHGRHREGSKTNNEGEQQAVEYHRGPGRRRRCYCCPAATTDCNATGAICTADGRRLSNRVEVVVAGTRAAESAESRAAWVRGGASRGRRLHAGFPGQCPDEYRTHGTGTPQPGGGDACRAVCIPDRDSVLADAALTLAAHRQATGFVNEWFPEMPEVEGSVRCTAGAEFTGVAVEMDTGSGFFSSVFEEATLSVMRGGEERKRNVAWMGMEASAAAMPARGRHVAGMRCPCGTDT